MTPSEERQALDALAVGIEAATRDAFEELVRLIREGEAPRDAVAKVMGPLSQEAQSELSSALKQTIGTQEMAVEAPRMQMELSKRLYAQAEKTSATVADLVHRHTQGIQDARKLARDLYEGYGFRDPSKEPLKFNAQNDVLPRYLRDLIRSSPGVERDLARAYAKLQVDKLSTQALRAAYSDVLKAIDDVHAGKAAKVLDARIKVAFQERMRYFATRVAQTELHRAYIRQESRRLMEDEDVEYVQIRRASGQQNPCICVLYTGRERYGLGPGVYPKARAPRPPYHPFCRCVVSPRLDLTGKKAKPEDLEADRYFLQRLGEPVAARIVGSRGKLEAVMRGAIADDIHNDATPGPYKVKLVGDPA